MNSKILMIMSNLEDLRFLKPATEAEVTAAEKELGVIFAEDYREYVLKYGVISARGIELTGVTTAKRLDVVTVTKAEREMASIPDNMYVIENVAIDGIVVLQNTAGEVFSIAPHEPLKRVCSSLSEYVERANF